MSAWVNVGENLLRNAASGQYYVRIKRSGHQIWKSLKTDKITVARLRKQPAIDKIMAQGSNDSLSRDNLTLGECAAAYLAQRFKRGSNSEPLKPSALLYRNRSVAMLRENCLNFDARLAQMFTVQDCHTLMDRLRAKYSARRFNGALWALRGVLEVATDADVIPKNPALKIQPARIDAAVMNLPAEEKIELLMEHLRRARQHPNRPPHSFDSFLFCSIMLESGQRPGAIALLRPEHINLKRGTVDWVPFKHSHVTDRLPMSRRMRAIFKLLLRKHPGGSVPLLPIHSPARALRTASRKLGVKPPLTPHSFRHVWSTRMAEMGVAPALAAKMRRDKDGGTMFLRTYVHPRPETLREVVAAVDKRRTALKS